MSAMYGDDVDAALGEVNPNQRTEFMPDAEFIRYIDRLYACFQKPVSEPSDTASNRKD